jgi:hypothetical protein
LATQLAVFDICSCIKQHLLETWQNIVKWIIFEFFCLNRGSLIPAPAKKWAHLNAHRQLFCRTKNWQEVASTLTSTAFCTQKHMCLKNGARFPKNIEILSLSGIPPKTLLFLGIAN